MAQTVHLKLQIDGNNVEGESTISSMEREGSIECSSYKGTVRSTSGGLAKRLTRKRHHEPVRFTKRIDKSTPILIKALCQNEPVTSAEFRFFRPSPGGSGAEEPFYTVKLRNAYISKVSQLSEDAVIAGENAQPMFEEVELVFTDITWTHEISGATHKDSWRGE